MNITSGLTGVLMLASLPVVAEPILPSFPGIANSRSDTSANARVVNIAPTSGGPIGTYYVTDISANNGYLWGIRGSDYAKNTTVGYYEAPIAIVQPIDGPEIRTTGLMVAPSAVGAGYQKTQDLNVTPTGQYYFSSVDGMLIDGTSDTLHNYAVTFVGPDPGTVYSFDHDWSNASVLFDTGLLSNSVLTFGITYDRWNNSLWITGYDTAFYFPSPFPPDPGEFLTHFYDFSMTGNLLSSFDVQANTPALSALAMDADHTLWTVGAGGSLFHYKTDGTFLGSVTLPETIIAYGGEIAGGIPELDALAGTGALSLLGFALALAGETRRRV